MKALDDNNLNPLHVTEAKEAGLVLLGKSVTSNANYKRYRAISCGHEMELQAQHVRRNNWNCTPCFDARVIKLGSDNGLQYVKRGTRTGSSFYLLPCGHTRLKTYKQLKEGDTYCSDCFVDSIKAKLQTKSFTFVRQEASRTVACCDICNTEVSINTGAISQDRFECKGCIVVQWKKEAQQYGLTYLEPTAKQNSALYRLPCSCIKELRRDHVRTNTWACTVCETEGRFNKPGIVYLLKLTQGNFSWLKLGFSNNVTFRIESYGLDYNAKSELLASIDFDTCYEALAFEKEVHRKFKPFRADKKLMKKYHTVGGHTECYPLECSELLLKELHAR